MGLRLFAPWVFRSILISRGIFQKKKKKISWHFKFAFNLKTIFFVILFLLLLSKKLIFMV